MCCRAVVASAKKLEVTQPAAFAELYSKDYSMKNLKVNADGSVSFEDSDPTNIDMKGLTWGAPTAVLSYLTGASPAVVDVWWQDVLTNQVVGDKSVGGFTLVPLCSEAVLFGISLS